MRIKLLPLLAVAAIALPSAAFAKKKPVDIFAEFKGSFTGTAGFVVSSGGQPLPASCTLSVTGPKSGKSLRLKFSGIITGEGTAAYSNVITVTKNNYNVASGVFNFPNTTSSSVTGKAKVAKKKITGSTGAFMLSDSPATSSFTITSKTTGKKRTLTIKYNLLIGGMPYPFTFTVSGKAK